MNLIDINVLKNIFWFSLFVVFFGVIIVKLIIMIYKEFDFIIYENKTVKNIKKQILLKKDSGAVRRYMIASIVLMAMSLFMTTPWASSLIPYGIEMYERRFHVKLVDYSNSIYLVYFLVLVGFSLAYWIEYMTKYSYIRRNDLVSRGRVNTITFKATIIMLFFYAVQIISAGYSTKMGHDLIFYDSSYEEVVKSKKSQLESLIKEKEIIEKQINDLINKKKNIFSNIDLNQTNVGSNDVENIEKEIRDTKKEYDEKLKEYYKRAKAKWLQYPSKYKTKLMELKTITYLPLKKRLNELKKELEEAKKQSVKNSITLAQIKAKRLEELINKQRESLKDLDKGIENSKKEYSLSKEKLNKYLNKFDKEFPFYYGAIIGFFILMIQLYIESLLDDAKEQRLRHLNELKHMENFSENDLKSSENDFSGVNKFDMFKSSGTQETYQEKMDIDETGYVSKANSETYQTGSEDNNNEHIKTYSDDDIQNILKQEEYDPLLDNSTKFYEVDIKEENIYPHRKLKFFKFVKKHKRVPSVKECMKIWDSRNKKDVVNTRTKLKNEGWFYTEGNKTFLSNEAIKIISEPNIDLTKIGYFN